MALHTPHLVLEKLAALSALFVQKKFILAFVAAHSSDLSLSPGTGRVSFAGTEALPDFTNPVILGRNINLLPVCAPLARSALREPMRAVLACSVGLGICANAVQVFASPVAIIYNTPGIEELVLSRSLVDSILLGRTFLWCCAP